MTMLSDRAVCDYLRKRKRLLPLLLTVGFVALNSPLLAQEITSNAVNSAIVHNNNGKVLSKNDNSFGEIIVTATRSSERLSRVAASVTAYDQGKLDEEGVRGIEDISRLTPGVTFTNTGYAGRTQITIRAISSEVGAATTGIYIDDTPVQVRFLNNQSTNPYPEIFDIARVEVLRGPQGTLFGAGSEGGAVRFITPSPSLDRYSAYARVEGSLTQHGAPNWEAGLAVGGPIIEDKLGFRASASYRRRGGFIDWVSNIDGSPISKDDNYRTSFVSRVALKAQPVEWLTISPSIYYQETDENNAAMFNERISNRGRGIFNLAFPQRSPNHDKFALPALNIQAEIGDFTLTSVTSYLWRKGAAAADFSLTLPQILLGPGELANQLFLSRLPGYKLTSDYPSKQTSFTQELRLQTSNTEAPLTGILGIFIQRSRQQADQTLIDPMLPDLIAAYFNSAPVEAVFGTPMLSPIVSYAASAVGKDQQDAIFGELTYRLTDRLKITAGARLAKTTFKFTSFQGGPWAGTPYESSSGTQKEEPITPKFGATYSIDGNNLVYATASKGFRVGGANKPIPVTTDGCREDLASFGLDRQIGPYDADSVWSYEIGSKSSRLFDGKLQLFTSAYYLKWRNIQQSLPLPRCGFIFIGNLGSAVSVGGDVQFQAALTDFVQLSGSVAYNDAYYDKTLLGPPGPGGAPSLLVSKGNGLGGAPWTVVMSADFKGDMFGRETYANITYTYNSRNKRRLPAQDPGTLSYDPEAFQVGATDLVNVRAGVRLSGFDLSLFVNNLTDESPLLYRNNFAAGLTVFMNTTYTPRTFGVTGTYSF